MLTRFHKLLIAALVVQIVLAAVVLTRGDDTTVLEQKPILARFDAAKVTRVQVATANGTPVDLIKRGDAWLLASGFDYPVMASKVGDLLSSLAKLSAASPIATQASRHKQLRVADDEFERKLTLTVDGKDTTLLVGSAAGARRNALRLAGDSRVFAVSGVAPWSISASGRDWVDPSYVRVPKDEIRKLAVQRGTRTFELAREKAGDAWTATSDGKPVTLAAGESLDAGAIEKLLGDASTIDVGEPADPRWTVTPTATITIERFASDTSVAPVVIDVFEDGAKYWVHQRGIERAVRVEKSTLEGVVTAGRDRVVTKAPSTSQATPGKGGASSG